jgi:hypothetical protein
MNHTTLTERIVPERIPSSLFPNGIYRQMPVILWRLILCCCEGFLLFVSARSLRRTIDTPGNFNRRPVSNAALAEHATLDSTSAHVFSHSLGCAIPWKTFITESNAFDLVYRYRQLTLVTLASDAYRGALLSAALDSTTLPRDIRNWPTRNLFCYFIPFLLLSFLIQSNLHCGPYRVLLARLRGL